MFQFFRTLFEPESDESTGDAYYTTSAVRRAIAALLIEVARADANEEDSEQEAIRSLLIDFFHMPEDEAATVFDEATHQVDDAIALHPFTETLRRELSRDQRSQVVEMMWAVAYADGVKDADEEHLIRKVAELMHVSQAHFVRGRQRVQAALQTS